MTRRRPSQRGAKQGGEACVGIREDADHRTAHILHMPVGRMLPVSRPAVCEPRRHNLLFLRACAVATFTLRGKGDRPANPLALRELHQHSSHRGQVSSSPFSSFLRTFFSRPPPAAAPIILAIARLRSHASRCSPFAVPHQPRPRRSMPVANQSQL